MIFLTIFLLVIAILGFIVPTMFAKVPADSSSYERKRASLMKRLRLFIPLITAVILIVILGIGSIEIIDQTEVGVVRTFGEITGTLTSGMNFTNPLTQTVEIYDTKVHSLRLEFASYTKDAQPVDVVAEVQYQLSAGSIMQVAGSYGSYEVLEQKLTNVTEERIKVVLAKSSAMTLMENRSSLSSEAKIEVSDLSNTFPITFTSVIISDVAFSDAFEASVEAKMTAEQSALRAEQEKKEAITRAEQEREVAKIDAEAAIVAAQAEADAMLITKEALEAMPKTFIEQMWIDKWNGQLPEYYGITEGGLMIVPEMAGATN